MFAPKSFHSTILIQLQGRQNALRSITLGGRFPGTAGWTGWGTPSHQRSWSQRALTHPRTVSAPWWGETSSRSHGHCSGPQTPSSGWTVASTPVTSHYSGEHHKYWLRGSQPFWMMFSYWMLWRQREDFNLVSQLLQEQIIILTLTRAVMDYLEAVFPLDLEVLRLFTRLYNNLNTQMAQ